MEFRIVKPCLSAMLLVNFSLWNETTFCIHCSPVEGESGWMYILLGISGSAFPAIIHLELWNLYLQSSAATISINMMYLAFLSSPETRTLKGGNIRLSLKSCNQMNEWEEEIQEAQGKACENKTESLVPHVSSRCFKKPKSFLKDKYHVRKAGRKVHAWQVMSLVFSVFLSSSIVSHSSMSLPLV